MERTYSVCCGVDAGKSSHHFAAIIPATGELVFDGKVEQSESGIREALLSVSLFGSPVVVVDQPGNMAALLFAVCDDMGIAKGFITPRAMSQAIEMYGGDIKTDAHDALVIAEVSSSLPKLVKPVSEKSALSRVEKPWREGRCAREKRIGHLRRHEAEPQGRKSLDGRPFRQKQSGQARQAGRAERC